MLVREDLNKDRLKKLLEDSGGSMLLHLTSAFGPFWMMPGFEIPSDEVKVCL